VKRLSETVLRRAQARGLRVATAESCTGGLVSAALTEIPGSSAVVDCGFVTYSNAAKQSALGVRAHTLAEYGAVSEPVVREMAEGALARSQADLAVAISGIAGPGGSDHKPEGRVCFAVARKGMKTLALTHDYGAIGRARVRRAARDHALRLLANALAQSPTGP